MVDKQSHSKEQLETWLRELPDPPIRKEFEREFVANVAARLRSEQPPYSQPEGGRSRNLRSPVIWSSLAVAAVMAFVVIGSRDYLGHVLSPMVASVRSNHSVPGASSNPPAGAVGDAGRSMDNQGPNKAIQGSGHGNDPLTAMNKTSAGITSGTDNGSDAPHSSAPNVAGRNSATPNSDNPLSQNLGLSDSSQNSAGVYSGATDTNNGSRTVSGNHYSGSSGSTSQDVGQDHKAGDTASASNGSSEGNATGNGNQTTSGTWILPHVATGQGNGAVSAVATRTGLLDTTTQTEDAFFLAGYGWHTAGLGTASIMNLPALPTDQKSDTYPVDLYFSVASVLSGDAGLGPSGWFGTAVEIDRLPLVETSPIEKDQLAYAIVLRSHNRIVGSWIDLPNSDTVGISIKGNTVNQLVQGSFASWLSRQAVQSGTDQPLKQKSRADDDTKSAFAILGAYSQAINSADLATVQSLLSPDLLLHRMLNDRSPIAGFSLGSVTNWEQSVQSMEVSSMVPIVGPLNLSPDAGAGDVAVTRQFAMTADVTYRDHPDVTLRGKVLWVTLMKPVPGVPWRIDDVTVTP